MKLLNGLKMDLKNIALENDQAYCISEGDYWCIYAITNSHYSVLKGRYSKNINSLERVKNIFFTPFYGVPNINDLTIGLINHE